MRAAGGPRRDARVLAAAVFLASPGLAIVAPLVADIRDAFGVGNLEAGLVVSVFAIARLAVDLPAGYLADRVPKRTMTIAGFTLLTAGSLVAAASPSFWLLLAGRALTGLGSGVIMTTAITWAGVLAPPGRQTPLISTIEASWMTSATVSPAIGGAVAALAGWRATFVYCAVAALASAGLLALLAAGASREGGEAGGPARSRHGAPRLLASRPVVAAYAAGFTIFFNRNGVRNTLLPLFAGSVVGLNPAEIGLVVAVVAGVTVAATLAGGRLADRWGRKPVLLLGFALLVAGNLGLLSATDRAALLAAAVVLGLGGLNSSVPAGVISGAVPQAQLGSVIGGYRFLQDCGFVAGPLAVGLVLDSAGYHAGFLFAACAVLLGLLVVAGLLRGVAPGPKPGPAAPAARPRGGRLSSGGTRRRRRPGAGDPKIVRSGREISPSPPAAPPVA